MDHGNPDGGGAGDTGPRRAPPYPGAQALWALVQNRAAEVRAKFWSQGIDPDGVSLAAWLDVGYSVLIAEADSTWRQLLDTACTAETLEDMELAIAALVAESQWRKEQHDAAESEHRQKAGAPSHFRSVSQEAMDHAIADVASWAGVPREPAADPDEVGE